MAQVQISTRVTTEIKEKAQKVLQRQGLDISIVMKMLVTKIANEETIPLTFEEAFDSPQRVARRHEINSIVKKRISEGKLKVVKVDKDHPEAEKEFFYND